MNKYAKMANSKKNMVQDVEEVDIPAQETVPIQEQQRPVLFGQSENVQMPEVYRKTREALGPAPEMAEVKKPSFGKYLANALISTLAYGNPIWGIMGTKEDYDQKKLASTKEATRRYERVEDQFLKLHGKESDQDFEADQTKLKLGPQWADANLNEKKHKESINYLKYRLMQLDAKNRIKDDNGKSILTPQEQVEYESLLESKPILFQPNQAYIVTPKK